MEPAENCWKPWLIGEFYQQVDTFNFNQISFFWVIPSDVLNSCIVQENCHDMIWYSILLNSRKCICNDGCKDGEKDFFNLKLENIQSWMQPMRWLWWPSWWWRWWVSWWARSSSSHVCTDHCLAHHITLLSLLQEDCWISCHYVNLKA